MSCNKFKAFGRANGGMPSGRTEKKKALGTAESGGQLLSKKKKVLREPGPNQGEVKKSKIGIQRGKNTRKCSLNFEKKRRSRKGRKEMTT